MIKLILQDCGSNYALFVKGDTEQETEEKYNSLYNFGATNCQPTRWTEFFGHIWTTRGKLISYLENSTLFELLGDEKACESYRKIKGGLMLPARQIAAQKFDELMLNKETILKFISLNDLYNMGDVAAEKETDFSDDKECEVA